MKLESWDAKNNGSFSIADAKLAHYSVSRLLLIEIYTAEHAALARQAFRRFGKGRHPAALNFGDCIAYSVAKFENAPLLFKGNDFIHTDIEPALKS